MIHLSAFALCVAGFAVLALSARRQQRELFGGSLQRGATRTLRASGACLLLVACSMLVGQHGWSLGLVMFSGHTSIGAGAVYLALVGYGAARTE